MGMLEYCGDSIQLYDMATYARKNQIYQQLMYTALAELVNGRGHFKLSTHVCAIA